MGQDGFGDIQACSVKLHNFKDYSLLVLIEVIYKVLENTI